MALFSKVVSVRDHYVYIRNCLGQDTFLAKGVIKARVPLYTSQCLAAVNHNNIKWHHHPN